MKATIDIPADQHRKVKAKSALLGRSVKEITIELYRQWLGEAAPSAPEKTSEEWLNEWLRLGEASLRDAPSEPTATQILTRDRDRLDRS